jgi:serine/threonine protein phosphatase PrpC
MYSVLSQLAAAADGDGSAAAAAAAVTVEAGAFGALGPREAMEDRHVLIQGLGGDSKVTLAAVFDGHRGYEAAAYAAAQLPRNLLIAAVDVGMRSSTSSSSSSCTPGREGATVGLAGTEPGNDSSSASAMALKEAFINTDAGFWQEWQAEMHANAVVGQYAERYPGCTALAAVIAGNQLFVANAGDGRAVISRGGLAVPLSRQHTADLADERARVVAAGGTVVYRGGSWRVGPAALQVTRALGDFDLKQPVQMTGQQRQGQQMPGQQVVGPVCLLGSHSPYHQQQNDTNAQPTAAAAAAAANDSPSTFGSSSSTGGAFPVTAEPEVVSLQLTDTDQFLVLGSDGLWDVVSDQEAVGLVNDTVKDPALCAKRLVQEALARGSNDNVTAVVLFLQPKSTLEKVWMVSSGAAVPAAQPTFYGSRRITTPELVQQEQQTSFTAAAVDELMDSY